MTIRRITSSEDPLFLQVLDLYHREFPPKTREPDEYLIREVNGEWEGDLEEDRVPFRIDVAEEEGRLVGFVRWAHLVSADVTYIVHIAVDAAYRSKGIGRDLVQLVRDAYLDDVPTVMEVEEHVWPWWQRLGARILTRTYTQPSLGASLPDVPLWLIAIPGRSHWNVFPAYNIVRDFYRDAWRLEPDHPHVMKALGGIEP